MHHGARNLRVVFKATRGAQPLAANVTNRGSDINIDIPAR